MPSDSTANRLVRRIRQSAAVLVKGDTSHRGEVGSLAGGEKHTGREIPAITAEEVAEARHFFPMEKFFIFGHARSGTTLLTRLVRLHPEVHCNYQAHFFTRPPLLQALVADPEVGAWLSRRSNRWNHGRDLSPLVLRAVSDFIMERDARREGKQVVGDKSPNSLLDGEAVRLLVKVYPDAKLVFIVRDGRDASISHRFQAFIDNTQSLNREDWRIRQDFAAHPDAYLNGQSSLFTEKSLRQAAEGWLHNVIETDRAARSLLPEQYHHLCYEALLADPHAEMHRLWAFLGVDSEAAGLSETLDAELQQNPDADWQLQKAGDIATAIQKGKFGSWQSILTERDKKLFVQIAGETLEAWGYSL
ncbi:MAG: sulfotransferase [Anaerolineales bacterium]|nr:sulfotransferase [Anaerolineales bacterium]